MQRVRGGKKLSFMSREKKICNKFDEEKQQLAAIGGGKEKKERKNIFSVVQGHVASCE